MMNNYKNINVVMGIIASLLVSLTSVIPQATLGQNMTQRGGGSSGTTTTYAKGPPVEHLVTKTDGGSLNLVFDLGAERPATITFLDPTNNMTVSSVDYDVIVSLANTSKILYKASEQAGQADRPLRSVNGFISIPIDSFASGIYAVSVYIYAISGVPLKNVDSHTMILCDNNSTGTCNG